jgi:hypothetical protein
MVPFHPTIDLNYEFSSPAGKTPTVVVGPAHAGGLKVSPGFSWGPAKLQEEKGQWAVGLDLAEAAGLAYGATKLASRRKSEAEPVFCNTVACAPPSSNDQWPDFGGNYTVCVNNHVPEARHSYVIFPSRIGAYAPNTESEVSRLRASVEDLRATQSCLYAEQARLQEALALQAEADRLKAENRAIESMNRSLRSQLRPEHRYGSLNFQLNVR